MLQEHLQVSFVASSRVGNWSGALLSAYPCRQGKSVQERIGDTVWAFPQAPSVQERIGEAPWRGGRRKMAGREEEEDCREGGGIPAQAGLAPRRAGASRARERARRGHGHGCVEGTGTARHGHGEAQARRGSSGRRRRRGEGRERGRGAAVNT